MCDVYSKLKLHEESKDIVVINTLKGLLHYTCLSFRVVLSPAIFQCEMEKTSQGLNAHIYLDAILITGKNNEEHLQKLNKLFTNLNEAEIQLHPEKYKIMN